MMIWCPEVFLSGRAAAGVNLHLADITDSTVHRASGCSEPFPPPLWPDSSVKGGGGSLKGESPSRDIAVCSHSAQADSASTGGPAHCSACPVVYRAEWLGPPEATGPVAASMAATVVVTPLVSSSLSPFQKNVLNLGTSRKHRSRWKLATILSSALNIEGTRLGAVSFNGGCWWMCLVTCPSICRNFMDWSSLLR